jgi:hypothetical protein
MENNQKNNNFTVAGTNINQVKKLNDQSGMSYNEVKEWMAKNTGGHGTALYSNTDVEEVKRQIKQK